MSDKLWWQKPMRVIQYNLQVADTPRMDPVKIARECAEDYGNAVVINVGGIYAWYPSKIKHHHVNEFLPATGDLLAELIAAFHAQNIKVIARFDFSKTDDLVYLSRPDWFVKNRDGSPLIYGKDRMGPWTLLLSTCINGGYRNGELAVPVIEEVLRGYDIDGIFFNAPHPSDCFCGRCREKYREYFAAELPDDPALFHKDWHSRCLGDNVKLIYEATKRIKAEVPVILYYHGFDLRNERLVDNLDERYATADMICTEAQDILSRGVNDVPPIWKPMLNWKIGNAVPGYPRPFGIIHSCPGMDWRHTGLPKSEYLFWMAQVMAGNAHLWHSITGFNDTVSDKRLLSAMRQINRMTAACETEMDGAVPHAQTLLLWDASRQASGWVDGMANMQIPFELMDTRHIDGPRMARYDAVILPDGFPVDSALLSALEGYLGQGGSLVVEKSDAPGLQELRRLLGVKADVTDAAGLSAAYIRIETDDEKLRRGFEDIELLPLRGKALYVKPDTAEALMTLVPPFAPLDAVGAPPERASIPVERTDIPMLLRNKLGQGQILAIPFSLSSLILDYHLEDHYLLLRNCLDYARGENDFQMERNIAGLLTEVYEKDGNLLVHLINGVGQRPLAGTAPYHDATFTLRLEPGKRAVSVTAAAEDEAVSFTQKGSLLRVTLSKLTVWNMLIIRVE